MLCLTSERIDSSFFRSGKGELLVKSATLKELLDLGLHFGHLKSYSHPKSKAFIFTVKDGISVIDLEKTKEGLEEALGFIKKLAKEDKTILFIGTKKQVSSFLKEQAEKIGMPYIHRRFMGGTLTNFGIVLKNIEKLKKLEEKEQELRDKSKKEHRQVERQVEKIRESLGGLTKLEKLPDAMFIVDVIKEKNAVLEANRLGIKTVAIVDTNGDPSKIDYSIPANDDSKKGVEYIVSRVIEAYLEGKKGKKKEKNADN